MQGFYVWPSRDSAGAGRPSKIAAMSHLTRAVLVRGCDCSMGHCSSVTFLGSSLQVSNLTGRDQVWDVANVFAVRLYKGPS